MNEKKNDATTTAKPADQHAKAGVLGEHPIGVSLGAVGAGAAAGAAGGAIGGPIGAVAGAAVGAVVGGVVGSATAEALDPTIETKYWKETYGTRPYADKKLGFDHYEPAYRYGWESFGRHGGGSGHTFASVESDLRRGWEKAKGKSDLAWDKARLATKDAWDRVESGDHGCCGDSTVK
ncbi:MAG: hypothetical protein IPJ41_13975 [Phycisphaerales bacterium]|nr:hypothetical protein [Phycisphaerales bacterium]